VSKDVCTVLNCGEETAAAASGAALSLDVYFVIRSFLLGNGRRRCERSETITAAADRTDLKPDLQPIPSKLKAPSGRNCPISYLCKKDIKVA
jgi:hypothetical protein